MRGHNEGSIYPRTVRRKDGTTVTFQVAAVSTPYGRRTAYARSKAEARAKLVDLKRARDAGIFARSSSSLASFLGRWLADTRPTVREQTARHYDLVVRHLIDGLGRIRLTDLSVADVHEYLRTLRLAPRTVAHHRAVLRRALNDARRQGLVSANVAALSRPPRVERYRGATLALEQAERLLSGTESERLYPLWLLALSTGQRQSELLGLQWTGVDLEAGTLRVELALARVRGGFVLVPPKTAGSRHVIPLTPRAVVALRAWKTKQAAELAALGVDLGVEGEHTGLVFTTPKGLPWGNADLLRAWYATLERHGLPRVRFHDLRHTSATLMLAAGYTLEDVKQMLGHSTIAITSDTYSHPMAARLREVAEGTEAMVTRSRTRSRTEGETG